jgi:hypothetical protein
MIMDIPTKAVIIIIAPFRLVPYLVDKTQIATFGRLVSAISHFGTLQPLCGTASLKRADLN